MDKNIEYLLNKFGEMTAVYYSLLEKFSESNLERKYKIMDAGNYINNMFFERDKINHSQVYWSEMLQRLHLAATVSLLRAHRWMQGVVISAKTDNYIVFAASLRGYLESTADSFFSLSDKVATLASNYDNIRLAIDGKLNGIMLADDFEESLIHFYAARKSERDKNHNATYLDPKTMRQYLNSMGNIGTSDKHIFYSELCEITHPAKRSTLNFVDEGIDGVFHTIVINNNNDSVNIMKLFDKYKELIEYMWQYSINYPLTILKTLNYFSYDAVYTKFVEDQMLEEYLSSLDSWTEIQAELEIKKAQF